MSVKRRLARFDQKTCIFIVFVCRLSPSIINYACPNFRTTCANGTDVYTSAWVWTLNASFNSIHVGGLC